MDIKNAKQILGPEFSFIFDDITNPVVQMLNINNKTKILDVGTGKGRMAITIALNNHELITGEPESDNSEYAKQDWLESAKKVNVDHLITFKAFDAEKMPFENNEFDIIFLMGALHHINNRSLAIKECIRTIKRDGTICIIEPSDEGLKIIRQRNPSHPDIIDPRALLKDYPFKIKSGVMFNAFIFSNLKKL